MSWFLWYITAGIALVIGTLLFDWPELKRNLKSYPVITIGALVTLVTVWPAIIVVSIVFYFKGKEWY